MSLIIIRLKSKQHQMDIKPDRNLNKSVYFSPEDSYKKRWSAISTMASSPVSPKDQVSAWSDLDESKPNKYVYFL